MWFVEYYIAGDPLPKTWLIWDQLDENNKGIPVLPEDVCRSLALGQDVMKVTITYIQSSIEPADKD